MNKPPAKPSKVRLDSLVASELGVSRTKAAALIMAGGISAGGEPARKPGQLVPEGTLFHYRRRSPEVSRAAGKLAPALEKWGIEVQGKIALDVGASTGGFTQVLLEAGAAHVYCVDVGKQQLAWKIRTDPRVTTIESTDIRDETTLRKALPQAIDLVTCDVSFISLKLVLPAITALVPNRTTVLALFKPQFEVGKKIADTHQGIITDDDIIENVLREFKDWLHQSGWQLRQTMASPVRGAKGNKERLLWLTTPDTR